MRSFKKNRNMKQKKIKQKGSSRFITGLRRKKTNKLTNQTLPPRVSSRARPNKLHDKHYNQYKNQEDKLEESLFAVPSNLRNMRRQSKKPVKSPSELQIIYNNPLPTMSKRQIQSRKLPELPSNSSLYTQAIPKSERHLMNTGRRIPYNNEQMETRRRMGHNQEDTFGTLESLGLKPRTSKRPRKRFFGKH